LLNIPRIAFEEYKNIHMIQTGSYRITDPNLKAMEYVRTQTPPGSLFFVYGPDYQTFLAKRPLFLGDYPLLGSHDVDTSKQLKIFKEIIGTQSKNRLHTLLLANNISYLYLASSENSISTIGASFLHPEYKNTTVKILKVLQ